MLETANAKSQINKQHKHTYHSHFQRSKNKHLFMDLKWQGFTHLDAWWRSSWFNGTSAAKDIESGRISRLRECSTSKVELRLFFCRFQNLERAHQGFIHTHHGTSIVKLPAIIGCGKYGYQLSISKKLIPILYNLQFRKRRES